MRASRRRAGASLLLALSALFTSAALAEDLLVMPYACSMAGGRPMLTPAPEQSHRVLGPREQRPYRACSSVNPGRCREWVVHRFDIACDGARVPWVSVVASFAADTNGGARLDGGRLVLRMPSSWSFEPDDPCARPPGPMDQLGFGRMRRYCADRRAMAQPPVVEMPFGFAPMLGIDGIFVKASGPVASGPPPIIAGAGSRGEVDRPEPWPPSRDVDEPRGFSEPRATMDAGPPSRHMDEPRGFSNPRTGETGPSSRSSAPPLTSAPSRDAHPAERTAPPPRDAQPAERATAPPAPAPKVAAAPPAARPASPTPAHAPPAVSTPHPVPSASPPPAKQAAAPSGGPDQPIVPKIINRPEQNAAPQAVPEKERQAEATPAPVQQPAAPAEQPAPSAAGATESESIRVNLLSAVQTPGIGIISLGVLALVLLGAFAIARRRERLVGAPQVRDIGSVSLGGAGARSPDGPRLPVPRQAVAQPPRPAPAPPPPPAPGNPWMNRIPQTRAEAMRILGMGVSPDATDAAVKRIVDGLRMSWHPDLAKDEPDRQMREFRVKQINAAWDLICGKSMERLDS